jgi:DNA-binding NtrC family response regulator
MKNPSLLLAECDETLRQNLKNGLLPHGFDLIEANGLKDVLRSLQDHQPDLVISGATPKSIHQGLKAAKAIRLRNRDVPIIFITKYSSEARVIAALRAGVNDYFKLPFSDNELLTSIQWNLSKSLPPAVHNTDSGATCSYHGQPMIGTSPSMQEIKTYLHKVASTDSTVLITGETGTGKELAAEMIHQKSSRHTNPFICINCAALPENLVESELFGYDRGAFTGAVADKPGKFVLAGGGSVFLDEIGDMNPYAQAKILRSIESKEVFPLGAEGAIPIDVRVIAATNQDPDKLMEEGKFRQDLYYRLNVARVHMPPLRDKREDIPLLIISIIENLNRRFKRKVLGLTDEAMAALFRYDWPGNVRELMNLLEAAFINLPPHKITYMGLSKKLQQRLKLSESVSQDERKLLVSALLETNWNKSKAAKELSWSRTTIYRKIFYYNVVEKRSLER